MVKNQNNSGVFSLESECDQKISFYKNDISGNYFFAKPSDAKNRVKATKVWIDKDGNVCVNINKRSI